MRESPPADRVLEWVPSEDPGQLVFRVAFSQTDLRPGLLPEVGVRYADVEVLRAKPRVKDFADWIRLDLIVPGPPGYLWFYFAEPKDEEALKRPFQVVPGTRNYDWPAVLKRLVFVQDNGFITQERRKNAEGKLELKESPQIRARIVQRLSAFAACPTRLFRYSGLVPFRVPLHVQPVPGVVSWDFGPGQSGEFRGLHKFESIPSRGSRFANIKGGRNTVGLASPNAERRFPATQMRDWGPVVLADQQSRDEAGIWIREKLVVYPPVQSRLATV